jgi:hypothetical protein
VPRLSFALPEARKLTKPSELSCPWCGEPLETWPDPDGGERQDYVEDCAVCCRPIRFVVVTAEDGQFRIEAFAER